MAEFRLSPRAERDVRDIWRSIAIHSERAADALIRRVFERLELATTQPQMGSPRPELSATARLLIEGRYVIIYEPQAYGLLVLAIVHGMRDPNDWL